MSATEKQKADSARTRRVAHVAAPVLWLRDQGQSSADGEAVASAAAAHPAGAAGIARRHRRGASAATDDRGAGGEPQKLQVFRQPRPRRQRPAVCGRDRNLSLQTVGRRRKTNTARQGADHRRQFQRHAGKPVRHLQGHGGDGRDFGRVARRVSMRRSSSASTTPARTSNIWIAARAASAWSENHGRRRRHQKGTDQEPRELHQAAQGRGEARQRRSLAHVTHDRSARQVS